MLLVSCILSVELFFFMQKTAYDMRISAWSSDVCSSDLWSNRDLQLEWATHRDKLQPGAAEEWQLTIKGGKKEAVAAELLAGLYDASLDALKPHRWNWNRLSPERLLGSSWTDHWTFTTRSEEHRVGKEGVRTVRLRGEPANEKKT